MISTFFEIRPTSCNVNEWQLKLYSSKTFFTKIAMNLYHDIRKNITALGKYDNSLSQNINKELFLFAEGRSPLSGFTL
jgi:hypothetical protein